MGIRDYRCPEPGWATKTDRPAPQLHRHRHEMTGPRTKGLQREATPHPGGFIWEPTSAVYRG